MSYYPQPYSQPPYGSPPAVDFSQFVPPGHDDLLTPARRAGILMIVLGVLIAFMGACNGGSAVLLTPEKMAENQVAMREIGWPESPIKPETARTMSMAGGGVTLLVGIAFVVTGVFVRRGTPAAVTTGLVLAGGVTLLVGGLFLLLILGLMVSPVAAGAMMCVIAVPLALLAWLLVWLVGAARNTSRIAYAKQQYQAQFYQYQQAYGGYAGGVPYPPMGYAPAGYAQSQPPPPSHPAVQQPAPPPPATFDHPPQPGGPNEPPATA